MVFLNIEVYNAFLYFSYYVIFSLLCLLKPTIYYSVDVFPHNYLAIYASLVSFKLVIASQIIFVALFIQYEWWVLQIKYFIEID